MVFITDRQIYIVRKLTDSFKEILDEMIIEAKNVAHFKELLAQDSSDLITGMLQKFQEREMDVFEELNSFGKNNRLDRRSPQQRSLQNIRREHQYRPT